MTQLVFQRHADGQPAVASIDIHTLIIAGWAGRNEAAIRHHIDELAALGVPPPSATPLFYRAGAQLLTQSTSAEVLGPDTSGEAEPVLVAFDDGLWLGIGSDHTDRKLETVSVAASKQVCPKPVGPALWRLDDVVSRWDSLVLRSHAVVRGERRLYQEGTLAALRTPEDLIARMGTMVTGTLMFGGTLPAKSGIYPADRFEITLEDPLTGRVLSCGYDIRVLPVVA